MQTSMRFNRLILAANIATAAAFWTGCDAPGYTKKERKGEPAIYQVTDNDERMNAAIDSAAKTWPRFATAFRANDTNSRELAVKIPYPTTKGTEHLWLSEIKINDGEFTGILYNTPAKIPRLHIGDTLRIDTTQISDWMYLDKGRLVGGYTIRVIRDQASPEERKKMDAENGWIVE